MVMGKVNGMGMYMDMVRPFTYAPYKTSLPSDVNLYHGRLSIRNLVKSKINKAQVAKDQNNIFPCGACAGSPLERFI